MGTGVDAASFYRSLLEDASRAADGQLRATIDLAPDPIFVRVDETIVFANRAAAQVFGADTGAELVGRVQRLDVASLAELATVPLVFEGKPATLTVAHGVAGSRVGDLLAHDEAERARIASDRRGQLQFQAIPVPTYTWRRVITRTGEDFILIDYNRAAHKITAGQVTKMLGRTASELFADRPIILSDLIATFRDGVPIHRDMDHTLSNGKTKRFSVDYIPTSRDLAIVFTEDISQRTELEEQLRHAQKMEAVGRLAAGVAHDFNNLLTVIVNCASHLSTSLAQTGELADDAAAIEEAANRATVLTRQLLAFSRKQVLQPRTFDLNVVLTQLESMLQRLIGEDVVIDLQTSPEPLWVNADRGQLEQVVLNLAINARDAMPEGGGLWLAASQEEVRPGTPHERLVPQGSYVLLSVRDNGQGMDAATRARIFEPFFTTKQVGRGTGLGLATVYGIIHQSGGAIQVESEPGKGTLFEILLPAHHMEEPVRKACETRIADAGHGALVLVVEDEATVRTITRRLLERAGYRVLDAPDGAHALAVAAETEHLDLLVTDMVMPGMGGRQLHAELAARQPGLRVLFMSGYTDDELVSQGELAPGSGFLAKPFTADALCQGVAALLARTEPRRPCDQP